MFRVKINTFYLLIFAVMFLFVNTLNHVEAQQSISTSPDNYIKTKLIFYKENIQSLQAKLIYIIEGITRIIQSGNVYYVSPDKLKLEFTRPVHTSIIQKGGESYLKSYNQRRYVKTSSENTMVNQADLFGFSLLAKYNYSINKETGKDESSNVKDTDKPADIAQTSPVNPIYYGYQTVNNEKKLAVVIHLDTETELITSYKLIGNAIMPQSTVNLKDYREINGMNLPHKLEILVRMNSATVKSIMVLRNVNLNKELDASIFEVNQ